jgi:hypothetical protein
MSFKTAMKMVLLTPCLKRKKKKKNETLARFRDRSGLCCTVLPLQLISVRPDVDTGDERAFSRWVLQARSEMLVTTSVQLNRWCAVSALGCQQSSAHCFAPMVFTFSHGQVSHCQ